MLYQLNESITIVNADCLEFLQKDEAKTLDIQMVFCDLPYGKSQNAWDSPIDLELFWKLLPAKAVVACTASNGFEYTLYNSNPKEYCYKWVWNKNNSAGFALAKKRPLNVTEDVLVFRAIRYYPQMEERGKARKKGGYSSSSNYGNLVPTVSHNNVYYPKSLLNFSSASQTGKRHPTQKPLALLEYLISTYTLPGETVLDPTMGSGSTGEACIRLGRKFVGIEKDPDMFFETAGYLSSLIGQDEAK